MRGRRGKRDWIHRVRIDLKPHSLALLLLLENIYSEEVINKKSGFDVKVVTLTMGDELSGRLRPLRRGKLKRLRHSETAVT